MRGCQGLADGRWALVLFWMRAQGVGHSGYGLRPQPNPASAVVCRGVVHDQSETRSKRTWASTVTGAGKLSNSMDNLAEAAHGHGSAWARSFVRGRSRPMKPMWAVWHKAFADVAQTASLSWRSPSKWCRPRGSAACACSTSTTCQEPAWFPLFRAQLNPARKCALTGGRVTTGYPVEGTDTTQPASPKAKTQPTFPCPGCTRWLPSSNAGCSEPTRDR